MTVIIISYIKYDMIMLYRVYQLYSDICLVNRCHIAHHYQVDQLSLGRFLRR